MVMESSFKLLNLLLWICVIAVPLGLWKLFDLAVILFHFLSSHYVRY